jgi:hypothetical protein
MRYQFYLGAGYWNAGKFVQHLYRNEDGKGSSTGYHIESYGANSDDFQLIKQVLYVINTRGIAIALEMFPRTLINYRNPGLLL